MPTVRFIHWKPAEAQPRIEALEASGCCVLYDVPDGSSILTKIRARLPDAILIDLTRAPSHGHAVGTALRQSRSTRSIPIIFVEGDPDKVARIRVELPDATYTVWSKIRSSLRNALKRRTEDPVVPPSLVQRYAATPLARKLGVKPGMTIAVFDAPEGFDAAVRDFPTDITWHEDRARGANLIFCFAATLDALESHLGASAGAGVPLWLFWPKRASGMDSDITQFAVRATASEFGLVDYKVCSFDKTWSGFLLSKRRKQV
jgi:CheY-like chemotaxis protein